MLDPVATWPVATAAAGVVGPDGAVVTTGPLDHRFAWASVTKLLTALAVLVAVEEGTVALDEPAGPPGATVRHLLAHAAGYAFDTADAPSPPGTRRTYSNTGYEVVADHLAGRAGLPFATYLGEAVLAPLGMTGTTLDGPSAPAAGAAGPLADLLRLAAELRRPTLVAPESLADATTVQFPGLAGLLPGYGRQDPNDWGLGPELKDAKSPHWTGSRNSPRTFGHFGRAGGFLWVDPDADVALAVLTDRDFGPWAVEAWPALADGVLSRTTEGRATPGTAPSRRPGARPPGGP